MIRSPKFNKMYVWLFALITVFAACTSTDEDKITKEEKLTEKVVATIAIGGILDTLWTDSASFVSLPKDPLVFSFTFRGKDTLTLFGWNDKGTIKPKFNTTPTIKLMKGKASTVSYGPIVYFGNVLLTKNDVDAIKDALKKHQGKYVLFAPKVSGEFIGYSIFVTKAEPMALVKMDVEPTGIEANPSPPKEW